MSLPPQPPIGRGRARGKPPPAAGLPPPRQAGVPQPMYNPAADPGVAEPLPIPRPRGRGLAAQLRPQEFQEELARSIQAAHISEAGTSASDDGAKGDGGPPNRGTCRQRPMELVTKPPSMSCKQGVTGQTLLLKANYFNFKSYADMALYQYRVDFEPDEERTVVRKAFLKAHKDVLGPHLFDGTVLYTTKRLHPDPFELFTMRTIDETRVRIIIKKTTDCVRGDYHYLQVLNIIIRKVLAALNLQLVGRDYYDPRGKVVLDQHNLEIWPGYLTSIRQHEQEILMNVDVSSKVMRNETAFSFLQECRDRSPGNWKDLFDSGMVGSTVITRYNNATYRIDDVDYDSDPCKTFDMKGRQITFRDYYREKYSLNIRHDNQPLLVSRPKAKDIRGGRSNLVVLVPELCCLTGITESMRSNFQMMKAMADHTRIRPAARIERLERGFMERIENSPAASSELRLWNMSFNPELITFPGRKLPAETIAHGGGKSSAVDKDADFTRNLTKVPMLHMGTLKSWVVIYPSRVARDIQNFCMTLAKSSRSLHFGIPEPALEEIKDDRSGSYVEAIERSISVHNPTLVMCILMNNKADRYEAIKKKCYVDRAIPSQVVLAKNLNSKGIMSICTKIAIQINCKLGGSPWSSPIPFKQSVMVAGFDVTHDTRMKGRSVGALVASLNHDCTRYFSAVSMHVNGEELSNDISVQFTKAIVKYRNIHKTVPSKIIFYRDGVGDGNIHYVLSHEVQLIKKALDQFYPDGGVKLCVVIVSKNINARIFQGNENPPPGTIVDHTITHPDRYDFYLVSQSVRQGTVSPTYYNVIYDEAGLKPDIMQRFTYKLTHLYYNWSGTVRVPAPVQYAHKLAFLVGQAIHRPPNPSMDDLLYFL
uniref:Protein piwi n=1 Tax=Lygus hesperus TaxID=30085 RepID=A0A0A9Z7D5_LYGHE